MPCLRSCAEHNRAQIKLKFTQKTGIFEKNEAAMIQVADTPFVIDFPPMNDEEFFDFCQRNQEWHMERDKNGNVIIMAPVNFNSGWQEGEVFGELREWNKQSKMGKTFSASTGFKLPNTAIRSADAAWVSNEKIFTLTEQEKRTFAPVCPEFIAEVRSTTDRLKKLQTKMQEWIENGTQLAWLIDPETEKAWIYRADGSVSVVKDFDQQLSGEDVLPGFEFDLSLLRI